MLGLVNLGRVLAAVVAVAVLASCSGIEGLSKANQPVPSSVVSKINSIGSSVGEAMIIRMFKEDSELEVWMRTADGTYRYLKSYGICNYSGDLGPKIKEGDRQSPEGFYSITPGLMNPNSSYYLAFNTGFPNKFDRAWGRTGTNLMIHGDCSSSGCYAITDEQIAEIYALGREAFRGGQRTFELQIFPFRMTVANMAKNRNNPNIDFWRNLKIGYDAFEISKREVSWDVCERRYVFNPASNGPLDAAGACPATSSKPELMAEVQARQVTDEAAFKLAAADLDAKLSKQEAERIAKEKSDAEIAARTAAMNEVVKERTEAIGQTVGGFFSGIWSNITGGGGGDSGAQRGQVVVGAPYPAPAIRRT